MNASPQIIALMGPTAVGKTALSVALAKHLEAEIIGCDSMQVYADLGRLSVAPTPDEQQGIPHHLFECVPPEEDFNVGRYLELASAALDAVLARGRPALIVGGTGLYLKALQDGLCEAPPADAAVREALEQACAASSPEAMHARLAEADPGAAKKIHPNDVRRVIRALEVLELTGVPLSEWWEKTTQPRAGRDIRVFCLNRERTHLYERIERRLNAMVFEHNIIEYVRPILERSLSETAQQIHGLEDIREHLERRLTLKEMTDRWSQRVRNYAKRQLTWFRHVPNLHWVELDGRSQEDALQEILKEIRS